METRPGLVDVIVVGAGVAGLACARDLAAAGRTVVVLERAHGVGGRCATRRIDGRPVDFGPVFLHGSEPEFLEAIHAAGEVAHLRDWPELVRGSGPPCQADAFAPGERRIALAEGVATFPESLSAGLDVRTGSTVRSISADAAGLSARIAGGASALARDLVLAVPVERARELVATIHVDSGEAEAATLLLDSVASLASLTVMAGYSPPVERPEWDVVYPDDSRVLQLISNETSKRHHGGSLVVVYQAHPAWSHRRLEAPRETWSAAMLEEAARILGSWAAHPTWATPHRWRHARVDPGSEFTQPILVPLPGGARLGLAGEVFAPGGGMEAAFMSGKRLARRLTGGAHA